MTQPDPPASERPNGLDDALVAPVRAALAAGEYGAALEACAALAQVHGELPQLLRLQGMALDGLGDYGAALAVARKAVALRPRNVRARLRLARALWHAGEVRAALAEAERVAVTAGRRAGALLRAGEFYEEIGAHEQAYRCRALAVEATPDDAPARGALADSAAALGRHAEAERLYDRALFLDPEQLPLLERRVRLRVRSEADHAAARIGFILDRLSKDDPRRAPVCYALAQELEDLGHFEPAFGIWSEGARCRRLALRTDPATERELLEAVFDTFDEAWLAGLAGKRDDGPGPSPVFVTGLAGCGLERVTGLLGTLPGVALLRDQGFFADAVTRLAEPADSATARLAAAESIDAARLAEAYRSAATQRVGTERTIVDVSAAHWPLLGLVRAAFPNARIIHVRRDPLDHCLGLFTTLFPRGHAWTYDLESLERHYATYHRLLGHWRRHLPGGFLDLDVESLTSDPAGAARRIAGFLDLEGTGFETVAAQPFVRGPGIGRWRSYAAQLETLSRRLRLDGVPVGGASAG